MKTAFVFSGQGAQYTGMGKELYDAYPVFRQVFDRAGEILDFSLTDLCFEENSMLNETEYTQPATFVMSMALNELMKSKGIDADLYAGFSLGEYSAFTAAGVFNFEDALQLVRKRGRFMTEAVPKGTGAMSAVLGLDTEKLEAVCAEASEKGLVICANYNMPGQTVIAGETEALAYAEELAQQAGAKKVIRLNVSGPFHTSLLAPASEKLYGELGKIELNSLNKPVYTNLTGLAVEKDDDVKEILRQQVMSPVLWEKSIRTMIKDGTDTFVELGPGRTLTSFIKKIDRSVTVVNVEDIKSLDKAMEKLL